MLLHTVNTREDVLVSSVFPLAKRAEPNEYADGEAADLHR